MENSSLPILRQPKENVFLIDWLSITFHGVHVDEVQRMLGLESHAIPWSTKNSFVNGYPMTTAFDNIRIRWGADDPRFYTSDSVKSAEQKARNDMGISLDMSGQGCRTFEEYSYLSWMEFWARVLASGCRFNVTRIDLAYDDHYGLIEMWRIYNDVHDRNYISKAKKTRTIWSDDRVDDIQGCTVEIGSRSSPVLIRIYDKAAERGFKDRHWIRVEVQLREQRAHMAFDKLRTEQDVGSLASGILRNYFSIISPGSDSNRSRAVIAPYWSRILDNMSKIRLWIAPGEPYNFSRTENHIVSQYGQALIAYERIYGSLGDLSLRCHHAYPGKLSDKYESAIAESLLLRQQRKVAHDQLMSDLGLKNDDSWLGQCDVADLILDLDLL